MSKASGFVMPRAYSDDLRCRVVLYYLQNRSARYIGRSLSISERTVNRIVSKFTRFGDIAPQRQQHGPSSLLSDFEKVTVLQSLLEQPGIYLREVQEELFSIGSVVSLSTICRTAKRLGLSRQRLKRIAMQRSEIQRARFLCDREEFRPDMFIFVDETGSNRRNSLRMYGYGIRGLTPVCHQLCVNGQRISAIGVMSMRGIEDAYIVDRSVNSDIFVTFVQRCLLPIIQPFDGDNPRSIVVLDNASIHHSKEVVNLISAAGSIVMYLPPYSPDLMPIEEAFSKVKAYIRDNEVAYQSTSKPKIIVAEAFNTVSQEDCIGYMSHTGYIPVYS